MIWLQLKHDRIGKSAPPRGCSEKVIKILFMEKLVDLQCFFSWGKVEIRKLFFEGWPKKCQANNFLDVHEGTLFTKSSKGEWKLLLKVRYYSYLTQLTVSFGAVCFRKAGRPEMYGLFLYLKKFIFSKKSLGGWDDSHSMADFFPCQKKFVMLWTWFAVEAV